ncbi:MAG: hypothetical protein HN353_12820 [Bdellovibrionales bacterium]|jgi:hypothetical protein|nr:hypothetical protein [Bdellovibrionales bacterium]MBT3525325.1 hypothetical protein [Bdellovibrionales bacterium]MBT7765555.1 hypothetical protein [Bdellovibrionales bacterium]
MYFLNYCCLIVLFLTLCAPNANGATVIADLEQNSQESSEILLSDEKIIKISGSKRIFILTNAADFVHPGDFISILLDEKLVARALVAKVRGAYSGIKILKIYSMERWSRLAPGGAIQVLRGDDSYYRKSKSNQDEADESLIDGDEDLFNGTSILSEDDMEMSQNKRRAIATDNIISGGYAWIQGLDNDGSSASYEQFNGSWAYQIADNVWAEFLYGENLISGYPSNGLDTKMTNMTFRIKYTIKAPLYSFIQPYVGYQSIGASSPSAGEQNSLGTLLQAELDAELQQVENLKKSAFVIGVTLLKRLVPGWFIRLDAGSDLISGGLSFEF